ncbi:MAG: hypothetical protein D6744_16495 [Planctomycetota bacterium]|nr:MAG: hypothetical protein D6744_16495 [Planctomycetota bacterium]
MELRDPTTGGALAIVAPMLAIETVAAGGGSVCDFDGVRPIVGPRSAGADPGPACYGRGGPLCVTDLNLLLGRIIVRSFPIPLDVRAARRRLEALRVRIRDATGRDYEPDELAAGYLAIANEHMAAAIRRISISAGADPAEYTLVCFGGAGGQHVCALARELGVRDVLLHPYAGIFSALGIGLADVSRFASEDFAGVLSPAMLRSAAERFANMEARLRRELLAENVSADRIEPPRRQAELCYEGQETTITIEEPDDGDWTSAFVEAHRRRYGFVHSHRDIRIRALRLELVGRAERIELPALESDTSESPVWGRGRVYHAGRWIDCRLIQREALRAGHAVDGPLLVLEEIGTVWVEPGWTMTVGKRGELFLRDVASIDTASVAAAERERLGDRRGAAPDRNDRPTRSAGGGARIRGRAGVAHAAVDPVRLELFHQRFAAVAEQMGESLRRSAVSTNIKERLDFSCAVLDGDGRLVANAPHIPVHLGALGACVRAACVSDDLNVAPLRPGDVLVTNDPYRGGSHLPDVTVISPVFDRRGRRAAFYVANRAHHAEIGGVAPGSMPASSTNLAEEGVLIRRVRLATDAGGDPHGETDFTELRRLLESGPYPSRSVTENLLDVQAQIAANLRGVALLNQLAAEHGLDVVQNYMRHIQRAAATKMRHTLQKLPQGEFHFDDRMDDGARIVVTLTLSDGRAVVDFTGTDPPRSNNLNATPAIVTSAVLYCFRCLLNEDVPLNEGVLDVVNIRLPVCFLNPAPAADPKDCPAVAGGNVETSQRIVDSVLGALGVAAASQGTMNNVTFGDERFGYYETIGGGAGAGPRFDGADAIHTHMTNTRLTDAEVLEDRYPVRLRRFAVRGGSGGRGRKRGGNGIVREYEFLAPLNVSVLSQRRRTAPYGREGGADGARGENTIIRADGRAERLDWRAQTSVAPGDVLVIATPGGGGWGD